MKTTLYILLFCLLSSCTVLGLRQPSLPEGRFFETCDINQYRAFTFQGQTFTEERQRPHLEHPVAHGAGKYSLEDTLLILHYEPMPEGYAYDIQYSMADSGQNEPRHFFEIHLRDRQTGKPLTHVDVHFKAGNLGITDRFRTGSDGKVMVEADSAGKYSNIHIQYAFYPEMNIALNYTDQNFHLIEAELRAGAVEMRESGTDTLLIHSVSRNKIVLEPPGTGYKCAFVPIDAYKQWEKEQWEFFWERKIPQPE